MREWATIAILLLLWYGPLIMGQVELQRELQMCRCGDRPALRCP